MASLAARIAFAAVSAGLLAASFALAASGNVQHASFKAFYCAGTAVRERHDPYRVEPLRSCERKLERNAMPQGYVEPAPLPGYALVPFAALSVLPPKLAAIAFALVLAMCAVAAAAALSGLIRAPAAAILLALAPLTLLNVAYGETAPLALLALCAAAFFLANQRWNAAGCAVALALVQPNVGLPAIIALLIFIPRARAAALYTGVALAAVSVAVLGFAANLEYLFRVLPLMASAELVAADQYSFSRLLYAGGVSAALSLLIGKIWFVAVTVLGVALAGVLSVKYGKRELVVLLPPAFVLLLGIYLHDVQVLVAIPAALAVAALVPGSVLRTVASVALTLLIAVWTQRAGRAIVVLDVAGVFGGLYAVLHTDPRRRVAAAAAAGLATVLCLVALQHVQPPLTGYGVVTHAFFARPDELSPLAWARYLHATPALMRRTFGPQLVSWLALMGLVGCAVATAYARPILIACTAACDRAVQ